MYNMLERCDNMAFGDRLLEILEEKEITQKELAAMLNIAPSTLNGYIKNKRQPDFELIRNIVFILDTSADHLLECPQNDKISAKEMSLIAKMRILSPEQQEMIYELVNIVSRKNSR